MKTTLSDQEVMKLQLCLPFFFEMAIGNHPIEDSKLLPILKFIQENWEKEE